MSLALFAMVLLGAPVHPALQQPDANWVDVQFHRVHLRNGAFIDGKLLHEDDRSITLRLTRGEMTIRRDQIEKIEFIKMRSIQDKVESVTFEKAPPPVTPEKTAPPASAAGTPLRPGEKLPVFDADERTKQRVDALLTELSHSNAEEKGSVLDKLVEVGGDAGPYMASLLDKVDRGDLSIITAAIVKLKDLRALPILSRLARTPDALLRTAAASGLGGLGDESAVPTLAMLTKDKEAQVRTSAINSLREMSTANALNATLELVSDPDREVRTNAIQVSGILAQKLTLHDDYVNGLARALETASPQAKFDLMSALAQANASDKWQMIADYLRDPDMQLRVAATTALARMRATDSADSVISAAAAETDMRVMVQMAIALRALSAKRGIDTLIKWLRENNEALRAECVTSLRALTGQGFGADPSQWDDWWSQNRNKQ